ncbi:MAG: class II fructose-bisphosphate aldolase [Bacillota bacterium]
MDLVPLTELWAIKEKGAVCGFDFINLEYVKAIMAGAEELNSPVILMATEGGIKYAGLEYLAALGKAAAQNSKVPVALHLDHCTNFDTIVKAIKNGFSSVMIDASKLPFAENLALTKEVVRVAHAAGVSVESELGRVGGKEDNIKTSKAEELMTDPEEAIRFVAETGIDCLAVAIGTAHGLYKGEPKLNLELLKKIKSVIDVPLVLHGGSDLPDETARATVRLGIRKFNIWTDMAVAQVTSIRRTLAENPELQDPRKLFTPSMSAIVEVVKKKIALVS